MCHQPELPHYPPKALTSGDGLTVVKGGLHLKTLRRTTVETFMLLDTQGEEFHLSLEDYFDLGYIVAYQPEQFNADEAARVSKIVLAKTRVQAREALTAADCCPEDGLLVCKVRLQRVLVICADQAQTAAVPCFPHEGGGGPAAWNLDSHRQK